MTVFSTFRRQAIRATFAGLLTLWSVSLTAQSQQMVPPRERPAAPQALPPATKLEGFTPAAGTVLVLGYDQLGTIKSGPTGTIRVDVREIRDSEGLSARGLIVEVTENEFREERSFVDADEIPALLIAMNKLLEIKSNPTQFSEFEVKYTTRGGLELTAFSSSTMTVPVGSMTKKVAQREIRYSVQAGRVLTTRVFLDSVMMARLTPLFVSALQKLDSIGAVK